MVDAKHRFLWTSCGYPENSHDSIITQSASLWDKITQGKITSEIAKSINGVNVSPVVISDSVSPFKTWLMKPYANAVPTQKQSYFNYCLGQAHMVTQGAYVQLKG